MTQMQALQAQVNGLVAALSSVLSLTLAVTAVRTMVISVSPQIPLLPQTFLSQRGASYVVKDHRFHASERRAWKPVAPYDPRAVAPLTVIPEDILTHWQANKQALSYASIRGLNPDQLRTLTALAKGAVARLGITRWGDIHAYKLVPALPQTIPHLASIPELVRRLAAVSEELGALSLVELVGWGRTERLASITRREIERDEGIGGAFQETDSLRKDPFGTVESWLELGGYAHRYPALQGVAQAVIEAAEAKVEKARVAVSPEVLSDINYRISQRTSYGTREEMADAPGTIIVWSNASSEWYGMRSVRKGERMTLDANQVFVPYPRRQVEAVLHKLEPLSLYKYSYEAIAKKKEQAKRLGAEGKMESDERWLEGLRRLGLAVYAGAGYIGAIPVPSISDVSGLAHIGGGSLSDGTRLFRLRPNPETGTHFYVVEAMEHG